MAVDLDHLLASTVYDPDRCSIAFHPLHRWPAIAGHGVLAGVRRTRLVGIGLLVHMALDLIDCVWMWSSVSACSESWPPEGDCVRLL